MGTSRQITESQLEHAKAALARRVAALQEKKVEAKAYKNDPKWRELEAYVRQVGARLRKIAELEKNAEELSQHKTERQAQLAAKKADRRDQIAGKKPKADKEADKPKGKAKAKSGDAKGGESKGGEPKADKPAEAKAPKKEKPPKKDKKDAE